MCYMGCEYEQYPNGPNEECRCLRKGRPCPMEEADGDRAQEPEPEPEPEPNEESQHDK